jgi:hypothetical protein
MGPARTAAAPRAKTVANRRITLCNVHWTTRFQAGPERAAGAVAHLRAPDW